MDYKNISDHPSKIYNFLMPIYGDLAKKNHKMCSWSILRFISLYSYFFMGVCVVFCWFPAKFKKTLLALTVFGHDDLKIIHIYSCGPCTFSKGKSSVPSANLLRSYWKLPIYSWFTHWKGDFHSHVGLAEGNCGFAIAMLAYLKLVIYVELHIPRSAVPQLNSYVGLVQ